MNKIILMGRLTREPEIRYTQTDNKPVARYGLAVDKRYKREDGVTADFFNLVAFGKAAEFSEKYLRKGMRILISGRVQTGTYQRNGETIPFFEVVVEEQEFAESKSANPDSQYSSGYSQSSMVDTEGFMNIPEDIDEELPFT